MTNQTVSSKISQLTPARLQPWARRNRSIVLNMLAAQPYNPDEKFGSLGQVQQYSTELEAQRAGYWSLCRTFARKLSMSLRSMEVR